MYDRKGAKETSSSSEYLSSKYEVAVARLLRWAPRPVLPALV